jgi:hypothetical protein
MDVMKNASRQAVEQQIRSGLIPHFPEISHIVL